MRQIGRLSAESSQWIATSYRIVCKCSRVLTKPMMVQSMPALWLSRSVWWWRDHPGWIYTESTKWVTVLHDRHNSLVSSLLHLLAAVQTPEPTAYSSGTLGLRVVINEQICGKENVISFFNPKEKRRTLSSSVDLGLDFKIYIGLPYFCRQAKGLAQAYRVT